jgi:hypothetical protein
MSQFFIDTNPSGLTDIVTINNIGPNSSGNFTLESTDGSITLTGITNGLNLSSAIPWSDKSSSFNAVSGNGYFITASATATLPASPSQGNTIIFHIDGPGTLIIQANTGQIVSMAVTNSSTGGTCTSESNGSSITLTYRAADSSWRTISVIGTWLLA